MFEKTNILLIKKKGNFFMHFPKNIKKIFFSLPASVLYSVQALDTIL